MAQMKKNVKIAFKGNLMRAWAFNRDLVKAGA